VEHINGDGYVADSHKAPAGKHDYHRYVRLARPAHNACHTVAEGKQTVKERLNVRLLDSVRNDCGIVIKQPQKYGSKEKNGNADDLGTYGGAENAEARALFYSVRLLCAKILADEGGKRHCKAHNGQKGKAFYLRV